MLSKSFLRKLLSKYIINFKLFPSVFGPQRFILTGAIGFLILLLYFIPKTFYTFNQSVVKKVESASTIFDGKEKVSAKPEQLSYGLPKRFMIPSINVDTDIEYVGLTSQGAVGAPEDKKKVAWFNIGPRPGDRGNAVISAHYGQWKNGEGSVFDKLNKVKNGDKIHVEDEFGVINIFTVRDIRTYEPKANAPEVFISNDDKAHLNLITCEGLWNKITKSYSQRLVVFADKE